MDHRDVDSRVRRLEPVLVILAQPPIVVQPPEGTFHDPASWLNFEAVLGIRPLDDFYINSKPFGLFHKPASIGSVRPHFLQPWTPSRHTIDKPARHRPVLVVRFGDKSLQDQALGINDQMALASFDLFAPVIASTAPFSVVFTDWLSTIAALGVASRPSAWRSSSRSA
jgi:hypothetical protein